MSFASAQNLPVSGLKTIGTALFQILFQETTTQHSNTLRLIQELRENQQSDRRWLPWVGLGGVVLALVLTVASPRFLASNAATCAVLGASWTTTTTGVDACVFYDE